MSWDHFFSFLTAFLAAYAAWKSNGANENAKTAAASSSLAAEHSAATNSIVGNHMTDMKAELVTMKASVEALKGQ